jgi:hypothetical protein
LFSLSFLFLGSLGFLLQLCFVKLSSLNEKCVLHVFKKRHHQPGGEGPMAGSASSGVDEEKQLDRLKQVLQRMLHLHFEEGHSNVGAPAAAASRDAKCNLPSPVAHSWDSLPSERIKMLTRGG